MAFIISSSLINAVGSNMAASKQEDAANRATDTQKQMFDQNKADLAPWREGGQQGNNALLQFLGIGPNGFDSNAPGMKPFGAADFKTDPGYQFALNQGENAIINKRSAMGGVLSGNTLKDLSDYGQGMASQQYQNAYTRYNQNINNIYSRLAGVANSGQNAAGTTAGLGANAANQISEFQTQAGNAGAAGLIGIGNAAQGGMNNYLLQQAINNMRGGVGASSIYGTGGVAQQPGVTGWVSQG